MFYNQNIYGTNDDNVHYHHNLGQTLKNGGNGSLYLVNLTGFAGVLNIFYSNIE